MNLTKWFCLLIFATLISVASVTTIAQTGILQSEEESPNYTRTVCEAYSLFSCGNSTLSYNSVGSASGFEQWNTAPDQNGCTYYYRNIYRSAYRIPIPVPSEGILKHAYLTISSSRDGEIVELPTNISNYSDENFFNAVGNASKLCNYNVSDIDIADYVSDFISDGYFYIGCKSNKSPHNLSINCWFWWEIPAEITFKNNFDDGNLYVNGLEKNNGYSNGYWLGANLSLGAIENQTDGSGYTMIWNDSEAPLMKSYWERTNKVGSTSNESNNQNYSFAVSSSDEEATYTAILKRKCYIALAHQYDDYEDFSIYVNGSAKSSPSENNLVYEGNEIEGRAINQTIDDVEYTFSKWNTGTTNLTQKFYPTENKTYTAEFNVEPKWTNRNLHTNSTPGAYITVYWNEHPCSDVVYKIYRKIKNDGVMGSELLCATVSHGTTSWTDNIQIADGQTTMLVFYDVRAYHTPSSTYSDVYYESTVYTWTEENIQTEDQYQTAEANENALAEEEVTPTETTLGNFPNPFNPSTVISWQWTVRLC